MAEIVPVTTITVYSTVCKGGQNSFSSTMRDWQLNPHWITIQPNNNKCFAVMSTENNAVNNDANVRQHKDTQGPCVPRPLERLWREWDGREKGLCMYWGGGGGGGGGKLWRDALIPVLFMQISTTSTAKKQKQNEHAVTVGINMKLPKKISTSLWPDPQKDREGKGGRGEKMGGKQTFCIHTIWQTTHQQQWMHTGTYYVNAPSWRGIRQETLSTHSHSEPIQPETLHYRIPLL